MNKLKELRLQKGLSQKEISNQLQIEYQNYNKYELDKNEPNIETLKKIADYYDVSIDFLVGRPRPFDFPIIATEEQKQIINKILELSNEQCKLVEAYITGLQVGQEKLNETIKKLSN